MITRNKAISVFLKANEASLSAPLGPILSQYDQDFKEFIFEFNSITQNFVDFEIIFSVLIFLIKNEKKVYFLCKFPTTSFFINFFTFDNKIYKTDIYNITKIKVNFNFINLKILYKLILSNCKSFKLEILNA
jgi:ribosomal protein L11